MSLQIVFMAQEYLRNTSDAFGCPPVVSSECRLHRLDTVPLITCPTGFPKVSISVMCFQGCLKMGYSKISVSTSENWVMTHGTFRVIDPICSLQLAACYSQMTNIIPGKCGDMFPNEANRPNIALFIVFHKGS